MSVRPGILSLYGFTVAQCRAPGSHAWSVCWGVHSGRLPDLNPAQEDGASIRLVCCVVAKAHFEFEEFVYTWNICMDPYGYLGAELCAVGAEPVNAGLAKKS